ncbi:hypothetical protein ULMS_29370 [Patiriisocius marinistellae]|uniref:Uncharacterized protein n=1 Tax=Patiriisocius marinistellae TaxID=2494560 RepID=A0A5J4G3A5_9FLAO|nr:hypothetical protein [Patiriisocius marinistellae]GEQ87429.1 hypothetical protein ULMS_29370 [Patiriisocius marinistellae]
MIITFNDKQPKVEEATEMANSILKNPVFYSKIREKNNFDLSTASPQIIADLIENSDLEFKVDLFYPSGWRAIKYRKTFAYMDHRFPNTLFLNLKKLNRSSRSIAATIIHESLHALDHEAIDYTFGHGNNSSKGKSNTAPYWIGNLANKILKDDFDAELLVFDQVESDENDYLA